MKIQLSSCSRIKNGNEDIEDRFTGSRCKFTRLHGNDIQHLPNSNDIQASAAGGWLLSGKSETLWLPNLPVERTIDEQGHILRERVAEIPHLKIDDTGIRFSCSTKPGNIIDYTLWQLTDELVRELEELSPVEKQPYCLWGSHTRYRRPSDLYLHLIHGWIYENRATWPNYWKICSENDAHALYVLFSGLERITGKRLYGTFKQQLVLSVISRQNEDGGWRHGEWTDDMESHFRLHTSALHLLLDAWEEHRDPVIAEALEKGVEFLIQQADRLDTGLWFLHDSLERSEAAMRKSPFQWLPSRAFGKSVSNMLVLNSHWDTTIAVHRAAIHFQRQDWMERISDSNQATEAVLSAQPADWLYKLLFWLISLDFLPTEQASQLPIWKRALKRVGWKYVIPYLHYIRRLFPRLVMPGGYLDRALSLKGIATAYQAINVMDLVRLHHRFPDLRLRPFIDAAIDFTYRSGLWERWAEEKRAQYAYGFWAEALHHLCLLDGDKNLRKRLAETMVRLDTLGLGLPVGLLGGDRERRQPPKPAIDLHRLPEGIRFADLSREGREELLFVCTGDKAVVMECPSHLAWKAGDGSRVFEEHFRLAPGQWIIGANG